MGFYDNDGAGHAARAANDKAFDQVDAATAGMREAANDRHATDGPHPAPVACTGNAGVPACGLPLPCPV